MFVTFVKYFLLLILKSCELNCMDPVIYYNYVRLIYTLVYTNKIYEIEFECVSSIGSWLQFPAHTTWVFSKSCACEGKHREETCIDCK